MQFAVTAIGIVHNERKAVEDDNWLRYPSEIRLIDDLPAECLDGIDAYSHIEIVYVFHQVLWAKPVIGAEHPRENPAWPKVGIYAQRKKARPNFIGCTITTLLQRDGRRIFVERLDAIDGTPVLDIKPVLREFLPYGEVRQPGWADELMRNYW
ncbi:MAG: SAM-dependent methyltransferase [Candidatus Hydrogenedentes bacterium]|nr:SAM-dependent methyltransferase [Candidatus Hydrogenedentota bacterium]